MASTKCGKPNVQTGRRSGNTASMGNQYRLALRGLPTAKDNDGRGNERICKLNVSGIKAVYLQKLNLVREIPPEDLAIVHVHELSRNEPCSNSILCKPIVSSQKKVNIKTAQATDIIAHNLRRNHLKPGFIIRSQMMMTHVRRICKNDVRK